MPWFAAHVIMYITWEDGERPHVPVWENVLLVEASTAEEARTKAEAMGREDEGDSGGTLIWDGRRARWNFAGLRKLITCVDSESRPSNGTEVTYSEFRLRSQSDLDRLVGGGEVELHYVE